jgi:thiosulfate dehydrogenase
MMVVIVSYHRHAYSNSHPPGRDRGWPASNTKKKGNTTWRCKSCHGWDNLGKDGAYASGSYKTGIMGVRALALSQPSSYLARTCCALI